MRNKRIRNFISSIFNMCKEIKAFLRYFIRIWVFIIQFFPIRALNTEKFHGTFLFNNFHIFCAVKFIRGFKKSMRVNWACTYTGKWKLSWFMNDFSRIIFTICNFLKLGKSWNWNGITVGVGSSTFLKIKTTYSDSEKYALSAGTTYVTSHEVWFSLVSKKRNPIEKWISKIL